MSIVSIKSVQLYTKSDYYELGVERAKKIFSEYQEAKKNTKIKSSVDLLNTIVKGDYEYSKDASKRKDRPKGYRDFHKGKSTELGKLVRSIDNKAKKK